MESWPRQQGSRDGLQVRRLVRKSINFAVVSMPCLVGVGTVLADDPSLTARTRTRDSNKFTSRQPLRIVVDSRLRTPLKAQILAQQYKAKTIIATTAAAPIDRRSAFLKKGIEVLTLPAVQKRVSLPALLKELGRRGVMSLLVEGGGEINAAMLKAKLVDHIRLYMAPLLLGGQNAKGVIGGESPARLKRSDQAPAYAGTVGRR